MDGATCVVFGVGDEREGGLGPGRLELAHVNTTQREAASVRTHRAARQVGEKPETKGRDS